MRFYYDGQLCFTHSWTPDAPLVAPQPFDKPFNIVMSQAMGQGWNPVDSTTPKTGTLEVDWVDILHTDPGDAGSEPRSMKKITTPVTDT